jgi:uncharacterized protein YidB (DUF937 family)
MDMARSGFPSMTALLGLLAVAGYQNRDKIAEMMRNRQAGTGGTGGQMSGQMGGGRGGQMGGQTAGMPGGLGGLLGGLLGGGAGAGGLGGLLGGGLGELDQQFRRNGRGDVVDSWVSTGPNREIQPHDLEATLGPEVLDDLTEATGLSRQELLQRLSRELPHAVDQYTPQGRLPDPHEFH